jgi:L-ribulose-5-phosphate 3-epimerase UlaE
VDNVNLGFYSLRKDKPIMPILTQLMPMIGNINSMSISKLRHWEFGSAGSEPNKEASKLLTTMLTSARILDIK